MPEGTTTYKGGKFESFKGSEAGKDTKYNAMAQKDIEDAYLKSKGWNGLGGASKRKPGWQQSPEFQTFAKDYAKSQGQKKAMTDIKTMPLPHPEPSPNVTLYKDEKK